MYLKINRKQFLPNIKNKSWKSILKTVSDCITIICQQNPILLLYIILVKKSKAYNCQNNAKNGIQNIKLIYIFGITNTKWLTINFQPKNYLFSIQYNFILSLIDIFGLN